MPILINKTNPIDLTTGTFINTNVSNGVISLNLVTAGVYEKSGTVEFPVIDLTQYFKTITSITNTATTLSGSSLVIYTSTSNDNDSFTPYLLINGDGTIASPQNRYIKIKVVLTAGLTNSTTIVNDFITGESSQFNTDDKVIFDGSLYLKTSYLLSLTENISWSEAGREYEIQLDKTLFKTIQNVSVI